MPGASRIAQLVKHLPSVQETWVGKVPLEEEIATHSSVLAWRIPWTKEPGGLESVGSQKATEHAACTHTPQSLERENSIG